jgi:hypothetical protein
MATLLLQLHWLFVPGMPIVYFEFRANIVGGRLGRKFPVFPSSRWRGTGEVLSP